MGLRRYVVGFERVWDNLRQRRSGDRTPEDFRIETYGGHGSATEGVVVRGRVLDDPLPTEAVEGERVGDAVRRTLKHFVTDELSGVPLRVSVGDSTVEATSDAEGYFLVRLRPTALTTPSTPGSVELAGPYRGLTDPHRASFPVSVPPAAARFGVISDVDDTILETGVQRVGHMIKQTFTGSALTRTPFEGAPELYRDLEAGVNPVFYVSSSPWNLHPFLVDFLDHRAFPRGPVLLRDLLGTDEGREQKSVRLHEILDLHPTLRFVLLGDSGEHDPQIYAQLVREYPERIIAVYIREVRLDPGDGRVEEVSAGWAHADVPFVLAADSDAVREHAASIGLL